MEDFEESGTQTEDLLNIIRGLKEDVEYLRNCIRTHDDQIMKLFEDRNRLVKHVNNLTAKLRSVSGVRKTGT